MILDNLYDKRTLHSRREGEEIVREYIRKKSPKYTGKGLRKYSNVIVANIKRLSKESTLNTRNFAKSVGIDRKMIRSMVNGKYEDTSHHTCGLCYYSGILKI